MASKQNTTEWGLAKHYAGEAKEDVKEAGKHAVAATSESLGNARDAAGEELAHAKSQARSMAHTAENKVEGVRNRVEKDVHEAQKSSRKTVDEAHRAMGDKATANWASPRDLQQAAEDATEQIEKDGKGLIDRVKGFAGDIANRFSGSGKAPNGAHDHDEVPAGAAGAHKVDSAIEKARHQTKHAADATADKAHDVARTTSSYTQQVKEDVQYGVKRVEDAAHGVADKANDAAHTAADKVAETRRWMAEQAEAAKEAWVDSITAHNQEELLLSEGLIPSNTEDVLKGKSDV